MQIQLIDTGRFFADGGAMFGAVPKTAWSRRYPANEANGCVLVMRSLLVSTDCGRVILVDTGAGNKHLKQLSYYGFFHLADLAGQLLERGISPADVTDVVLTHLHFDHCGYATQRDVATGALSLSFPNACHWVGSRQWDNFLRPSPLEADSYFIDDMQAVADAGCLRLIDSDEYLCPRVQLRLFDGHTPGQIVPYVETDRCTYIFAGDVVPLAACLSPAWISAYDTYPVASFAEKLRMLNDASQKGYAIIFCHDAYTPCCSVKKVNEFYTKDSDITL